MLIQRSVLNSWMHCNLKLSSLVRDLCYALLLCWRDEHVRVAILDTVDSAPSSTFIRLVQGGMPALCQPPDVAIIGGMVIRSEAGGGPQSQSSVAHGKLIHVSFISTLPVVVMTPFRRPRLRRCNCLIGGDSCETANYHGTQMRSLEATSGHSPRST